ncbi:MAG: hypothetical protein R3F62_10850 [Planctomycetota bacterium]
MQTLDPRNLTGEQLGTLERLTQACLDLARIDREAARKLEGPAAQLHPRGAAGLLKTFASEAERASVRLADLAAVGDARALGGRSWGDVAADFEGANGYAVLLEVEQAHGRLVQLLGEKVLAHADDGLGATLLQEYAKATAICDRVRSLRVASREPLAS